MKTPKLHPTLSPMGFLLDTRLATAGHIAVHGILVDIERHPPILDIAHKLFFCNPPTQDDSRVPASQCICHIVTITCRRRHRDQQGF